MPRLSLIFILVSLFFLHDSLFSQSKKSSDSHINQLISNGHIQPALQLKDSMIQEGTIEEMSEYTALVYNQISQYYRNENILDSAIYYKEKAWDILKKQDYNKYFDQYLPTIAYRNWEAGNYSSALNFALEALRNIEMADSSRYGRIHNILGLTYLELGNYELSEKNFKKAIHFSQRFNNQSYTGILYANMGKLYFQQGKLEKALRYYNKGSAIEAKHNNHQAAGRSYADMGNIYVEMNNYETASKILKKAREENKLANDDLGLSRTFLVMGNLSLRTGDYKQAEKVFYQAIEHARLISTQKELMDGYYGLYRVNQKLKDYEKACHYMNQYFDIYKDLFSIEEIIRIENLQHQLNLEEEKNLNQKAQLKKQKTINRLLYAVIGLSLITSFTLIVLLIKSRKSRQALKKKNQEISRQKEDLETLNKELTEAKTHAENSEALKDQFLRNISHEIRTPLNGIIGFSTIMAQPNITNEEKKSYQIIIEQNAKTLLSTIEDIIDIAKIKTQQIKIFKDKFDVNGLMYELQKIIYFEKSFQNKEKVEIIIDQNISTQQFIHSDQQKIRKTLLLLSNNALKFTEEGYIKLGYYIKDSFITFFIEDTGIGISQESQNQIFEGFRQVDEGMNRYYQGIGLGLTIAKSFTEILGGKLWFESVTQKGTTFYFSIPLKD